MPYDVRLRLPPYRQLHMRLEALAFDPSIILLCAPLSKQEWLSRGRYTSEALRLVTVSGTEDGRNKVRLVVGGFLEWRCNPACILMNRARLDVHHSVISPARL